MVRVASNWKAFLISGTNRRNRGCVLELVVAPLPLWALWQSAEALAAIKEIRPFSALRAYGRAPPACRIARRTSGIEERPETRDDGALALCILLSVYAP